MKNLLNIKVTYIVMEEKEKQLPHHNILFFL